jgi:hypothetical protein
MLKPLRVLENQITDLSGKIKNEFHEVVTLKGVKYVDKMKMDYREIIKKCTKIYKKSEI